MKGQLTSCRGIIAGLGSQPHANTVSLCLGLPAIIPKLEETCYRSWLYTIAVYTSCSYVAQAAAARPVEGAKTPLVCPGLCSNHARRHDWNASRHRLCFCIKLCLPMSSHALAIPFLSSLQYRVQPVNRICIHSVADTSLSMMLFFLPSQLIALVDIHGLHVCIKYAALWVHC